MTICLRLSQLQDEGRYTDEQASLAEAFCTVSARETVGLARKLLGGSGILLEQQVSRFVTDAYAYAYAEVIYSYEGHARGEHADLRPCNHRSRRLRLILLRPA